MMKRLSIFSIIALITPFAFAAGTHEHGDGGHKFSVGEPTSDKPDRIFDVSMQDTMRFVFTPKFNHLHENEVIRFNVRNDGVLLHEFSIGNAADQAEHAEMMRAMPDMKHEDPNTVSLESGESSSITWRFKGNDTVVFACNIPGHFEAGMHHDLAIR